MVRIFTQKLPLLLPFCLIWLLLLGIDINGYSQSSSIIDVDLTGKPNHTYTSPSVKRQGVLCPAVEKNTECVQFNVTLDPLSGGLEFDVESGSEALFYQVNCGPPIPVGTFICLSGVGPHKITLCKAGGNQNIYKIITTAAFEPVPDIKVTAGCTATLHAPTAFEASSVTWKDITYNGRYNNYLSCLSGCKDPIVTPGVNPPAYVDYEVCGSSQKTNCAAIPFCDVVRVYFYPPPVITVSPYPAIICPSGTGVDLIGNVTGGDGEFDYVWKNANGPIPNANTNTYRATAIGDYTLQVIPKNSINCIPFTKTVSVVTNLTANAGDDQTVCSLNPVQLSGNVTGALGGVWSGGAGTFSPNNTALNAVYTPTATEIKNGFVNLTLTSNGNGSCTAVQDQVRINFYTVAVNMVGTATICGGSTAFIRAEVSGAQEPIMYLWNTNETTASITNKPAGTYSVRISDKNNCSVVRTFTVAEKPGPTDISSSIKPSTCGNSNGEITLNGISGGTAPYSYSLDDVTYYTIDGSLTFPFSVTGLPAHDAYKLFVKDANGCSIVKTFNVTNIPGPSAVTATAQAATCLNNNGSIVVGAVTGGTAPYTYSVSKANPTYDSGFRTSNNFTGLAAGTYTVTAKDANGCTVTTSVEVNLNTPTDFASTIVSSTCGASNGRLTITGVTGGTGPYQYSKDDGATYQTSNIFNLLSAIDYKIRVKDANNCTFGRTITINNMAGPADITAILTPSTCGNPNGSISISGITGGIAPYSYSKDGITFGSTVTFNNLAAGPYKLFVQDANGCKFEKTFNLTNSAGPTAVTATSQASSCSDNDGRIFVGAVTGGTTPYTYSVSKANPAYDSGFQSGTSFTGLVSGTYTVTAKDANGCTITTSVVVTRNAPSAFTSSAISATCGGNNGSVTVTGVTGGTAPYQYSKDGTTFQNETTLTGLLPGNPTITVRDANNCTFSRTVQVNNIAGPSDITAILKASTCGNPNGSISITGITGGNAPYTYRKNNDATFETATTFNGLAAGTHTLYVKDANGCIFSKSFNLTNTAGPTAVAATAQAATCLNNNGSIAVGTVTGGNAPYTYSINGTSFQTGTSFTGLASGSYTVTAKDANNCTVITLVVVNKNMPTAFASTTVSSTCGGINGSITITSVTGGSTPYQYSKDNGLTYQSAATLTGFAAGSHTIIVKDANNCTYSGAVQVNNISGPTAVTATSQASSCSDDDGRIFVGAVIGGTSPYTYSVSRNSSLFTTSFQSGNTFTGLVSGTYTLTAKDANNCTVTSSVVVIKNAPNAFTTSMVSATCGSNNGSITLTGVTGGTAPYQYSTDGSTFQNETTFSALLPVEYTITVKDANGCTYEQEVQVSNIAGPTSFATTSVSSTCGARNGSITVGTVTGGTAPFLYSKDDGATYQTSAIFTDLTATNYRIRVKDANNCTFVRNITVNNITGPTDITAVLTPSTCGNPNGSISITGVTGGTASYTYRKNNDATFETTTNFGDLAAGTHTLYVKDANGCIFSKTFTLTNIAGPTAVAATAEAATCLDNNGSITVGTVTGGTAPFVYSINGTNFQPGSNFTGLASRSYTVTAKDANNCIVITSVVVNKNTPTAFASTTVSSTCGSNNGSITITGVTGGSAPYQYSRNGSTFQNEATFTTLLARDYTITVKDANGCTFARTVQVNNITGPTDIAVVLTPSTCGNKNGRITISGITGGTAPYTYSTDGITYGSDATFSSLSAQSYNLYVKDANGCTFSEAVELENIAGPAFTAAATSSTCGGNNGLITINEVTRGTGPYTYALGSGSFGTEAIFRNLLAGEYTIQTKDANNCIASQLVVVENITGPTGFASSTVASKCGASNGSIIVGAVTGGTAPYMYSKDNGATYQAAATFTGLLATTYTITVKDANNCTVAQTVRVDNIAGPTDITVTLKPSTCGNSNGEITLTGVTGGTAPYTYSLDGFHYLDNGATGLIFPVTIPGLPAATYLLYVKDANGCIFSKSFNLTDIAGPSAVAATSQAATCLDNNGNIAVGAVTGGMAPYTYSLDGVNFDSEVNFANLASGIYTITAKDANNCTVSASVEVRKNTPTGFTSTTVSSTCGARNGSIIITGVTGGTGPYMYSQDNGATYQASATLTGFAAGSHKIQVKDVNGCEYTGSVQVNDTGGPTNIASTQKPTSCGEDNGTLTITGVTGGIAPYTYSIDGLAYSGTTTFPGLKTGTHVLSAKDANGCVYTQEVLLEDITGATFTAVAKASTCGSNNGIITINEVSGTTGPYTFSRDGVTFSSETTFGNLLAGTYTITAKDVNGCLSSSTLIVRDIAGPTRFTASTTTSTCGGNNGSIIIGEVTGGTAPYLYSRDGTNFQTETTFSGVVAGGHTITVKDANGCTWAQPVRVNDIAGPADVLVAMRPSTCGLSDGQLTITEVSGGTAPYLYSKDGITYETTVSFIQLAAGQYIIRVKDANNCILTKTFILTNISGPTAVNATSEPATCADNNGRISVGGVSGGTAPYTYSLDGLTFRTEGSFANLASGNYTVSAKDANGCIITTSVAVGKNTPTSFTSTTVSSTCGNNNGQLTITGITGGTAPYTYSKDDGQTYQTAAIFTGLLSGSHDITVKDVNGCTYTAAVEVNDIAGSAGLTAVLTASTCGNKNGVINISGVTGGTAPYTYSLDDITYQPTASFNTLAAGTYTLYVKDANNCSYSEEVELENIAGPTFTATAISSTCGSPNGTISIGAITGGTAPFTYSRDGQNYQEATAFGGLLAGTYTITTKDANSCLATVTITVEDIAGPTGFAATTSSSTCGGNNGSIIIDAVTGGTAPYTYSKDGTTFETFTALTGLVAGNYTITVKDANGCLVTRNFKVDDIAGPSAVTASSGATTCADDNGSITIGTVTGGTAPYTYSVDDIHFQSEERFANLASGTYTVTAKDANNCLVTTTVVVEKNEPTDFTSTTVLSNCGRENGQLTITSVIGGTAPYTYSRDGITYQTSATFTGLAADVYSIWAKDANGCTYQGTVRVNNTDGPSDLVTTHKPATCSKTNGELTVTSVVGGTAPYRYSLDGNTYQESSLFTGLAPNTYQIRVQDATDCIFVKEVILTDIPEIVYTAAAKPATCGENNGQITISDITGGTAPYLYTLDGTTFQTGAAFANLKPDTYTITAKDANNCLFATTLVIEAIAGPSDFTSTLVAATCSQNNGSISISNVTGGTAPYRYALNGGAYGTSADFAAVGAGPHTIRVQDANGCVISKEVIITDAPGVTTILAAATPSACSAKTGTIRINGVTGGTAPFTYSLDDKTYQTGTAFTELAAGSYTIYVKDANACIFTYSIAVIQDAPQAAVINTTLSACNQSTGSLTIESVTGGISPYQYSINGAIFQPENSFRNLAAGNYEVSVKDAAGCTFVITKTVGSLPGVTAEAFTVQATETSCNERIGKITVAAKDGSTSAYTYSLDGVTFQASPEFTALAAGDYTVTFKDKFGCSNTKAVTVTCTPPPSGLLYVTVAAGCDQSNGQIIIQKVTGGTAPYTFSLDGVQFSTATTISGLRAGEYLLTVKDAKNSTTTTPVLIGRQESKLAYVKAITCAGETNGSIAITSTGEDAATTYSIDNGITFQKDSVFTNLPAGMYTVITRFSATCAVTTSNLEVKSPVAIEAKVNALTQAIGKEASGTAVITGLRGGVKPYTFQVDNSGVVTDSVLTNLSGGNHTVVVQDKNGCAVTIPFVIEALTDIEIPNGFTPNNDGINDKWVLKNLSVIYPKCSVKVFNRWGMLVFDSIGYRREWDGTYNGKNLPDGTYYCIIELGKGEAPLKKSVTIMR